MPNSRNLKIQDGDGRHVEFRENVNNSRSDIDLCTKVGGQMRHGHAEMTTWSKPEVFVTSSNECREQNVVDLSDYNRYLK